MFWFVLTVGILFTLINLHLPIVRNALMYARASLGIVQHNFNVLEIVRDSAWTSGKPILFSIIAAPFTWLFNANTGTIIASAIGTTFFLWMVALAIPRLNRRIGLDPSLAPLELMLVAFNPLVLYQFWSAYPDSLFAGFMVLAFILTEIIADEPQRDTRRHIVGLGLAIFLAIHTKHYGAVLGVTCPLYLFMHRRELLTRSTHRGQKLITLGAVFALLAVTLALAKLRIYPLLDLAGSSYDDYVGGALNAKIRLIPGSLRLLALTTLLIFQVSLLLLLKREAWRAWAFAPTVFAGIYLFGLLIFGGTSINMRYVLPVLPFIAPALAAGATSMGPIARRVILGCYGVVAVVLVLTFNVAVVQRVLDPVMSQLIENSEDRYEMGWLDNLRLPVQVELKNQIDGINSKVPTGSVLYWSASYYETGTHGLAEDVGIKRGLDVRYVFFPSQIEPSPISVFLMQFGISRFTNKLFEAPGWAVAEHVGDGLFRLDPFFVKCAVAQGNSTAQGNGTRLLATATAGDRLQVNAVDFVEGRRVLSTDLGPPFNLNWQDPPRGRHEIVARAHGENGSEPLSAPAVCYAGVPAFERDVRSSADIALELENRSVLYPYGALEISDRASVAGIRFDKIDVPPGALIANAYLEFTTAKPDSASATLEIRAELSANAPALMPERANLSRRVLSAETVRWQPGPWAIVGERHRSPNLAPILEEVAAHPEWKSGNAVTLLIHALGRRAAQMPGDPSQSAPRLYIELQ